MQKYPIPQLFPQEQWERNWQKYLKGVEPAAQKMIRDLQPCFRMSAAPENDPLSILNVLCNSDKHRAVTLTLAYSHEGPCLEGDGAALCRGCPHDTSQSCPPEYPAECSR